MITCKVVSKWHRYQRACHVLWSKKWIEDSMITNQLTLSWNTAFLLVVTVIFTKIAQVKKNCTSPKRCSCHLLQWWSSFVFTNCHDSSHTLTELCRSLVLCEQPKVPCHRDDDLQAPLSTVRCLQIASWRETFASHGAHLGFVGPLSFLALALLR